MNYIRDIVWRVLVKEPNRTDHLRFIGDAYIDNRFDRIDLFTLNHDTLIEFTLGQMGIKANMGFSVPINGVKYWSPEILKEDDAKLRLTPLL